MGRLEDAVASFERNLEAQTGKAVAAWALVVADQGLEKHGQIVAWLKASHQLSHSHANHIAKRVARDASPPPADDPLGPLFAGPKAALRPLAEQLIATVTLFGDDVEIAPKKANISLRRAKQFALIQPSTSTRLEVGLILKGWPTAGRLEASGAFNAMFTHRVRLAGAGDINEELVGWLREAYGAAG